MKLRHLSFALLLTLPACAKQDAPAPAPAEPPAAEAPAKADAPAKAEAPAKADQPTPATADPAAIAAKPQVIQDYEAARAALADDQLEPAKQAAQKLAATASTEVSTSEGAAQTAWQDLATHAKALSAETEIEAARKTYGYVSKALLQLIAAKPDLGEGLTAFRCPMAQDYPKWVQVSDQMANPYMGKRMLQCGGKVPMKP